MNLILLFFPTFISLKIIKERTNKEYKDIWIYYPIYNLLINLIVMFIVCIYKNGEIISLIDNFNIMNFCVRYLIVSIIVACIIPYIIEFILKNINGKIEIRREKKNEKN